MSQLALITPLDTANLPGFGGGIPARPPGSVTPPITLPPLPPGFKPPDWTGGVPKPPFGDHIEVPIFIPGGPPVIGGGLPEAPGRPPGIDNTLPGAPGGGHIDNTLPMPPGTIWPPLNPGDGVSVPGLLLVLVLGCDGGAKWKWIMVDPTKPVPLPPEVATPK
jgi:hypothetical protein